MGLFSKKVKYYTTTLQSVQQDIDDPSVCNYTKKVKAGSKEIYPTHKQSLATMLSHANSGLDTPNVVYETQQSMLSIHDWKNRASKWGFSLRLTGHNMSVDMNKMKSDLGATKIVEYKQNDLDDVEIQIQLKFENYDKDTKTFEVDGYELEDVISILYPEYNNHRKTFTALRRGSLNIKTLEWFKEEVKLIQGTIKADTSTFSGNSKYDVIYPDFIELDDPNVDYTAPDAPLRMQEKIKDTFLTLRDTNYKDYPYVEYVFTSKYKNPYNNPLANLDTFYNGSIDKYYRIANIYVPFDKTIFSKTFRKSDLSNYDHLLNVSTLIYEPAFTYKLKFKWVGPDKRYSFTDDEIAYYMGLDDDDLRKEAFYEAMTKDNTLDDLQCELQSISFSYTGYKDSSLQESKTFTKTITEFDGKDFKGIEVSLIDLDVPVSAETYKQYITKKYLIPAYAESKKETRYKDVEVEVEKQVEVEELIDPNDPSQGTHMVTKTITTTEIQQQPYEWMPDIDGIEVAQPYIDIDNADLSDDEDMDYDSFSSILAKRQGEGKDISMTEISLSGMMSYDEREVTINEYIASMEKIYPLPNTFEPKLDDDGNPELDSEGNPIMVEVEPTQEEQDKAKTLFDERFEYLQYMCMQYFPDPDIGVNFATFESTKEFFADEQLAGDTLLIKDYEEYTTSIYIPTYILLAYEKADNDDYKAEEDMFVHYVDKDGKDRYTLVDFDKYEIQGKAISEEFSSWYDINNPEGYKEPYFNYNNNRWVKKRKKSTEEGNKYLKPYKYRYSKKEQENDDAYESVSDIDNLDEAHLTMNIDLKAYLIMENRYDKGHQLFLKKLCEYCKKYGPYTDIFETTTKTWFKFPWAIRKGDEYGLYWECVERHYKGEFNGPACFLGLEKNYSPRGEYVLYLNVYDDIEHSGYTQYGINLLGFITNNTYYYKPAKFEQPKVSRFQKIMGKVEKVLDKVDKQVSPFHDIKMKNGLVPKFGATEEKGAEIIARLTEFYLSDLPRYDMSDTDAKQAKYIAKTIPVNGISKNLRLQERGGDKDKRRFDFRSLMPYRFWWKVPYIAKCNVHSYNLTIRIRNYIKVKKRTGLGKIIGFIAIIVGAVIIYFTSWTGIGGMIGKALIMWGISDLASQYIKNPWLRLGIQIAASIIIGGMGADGWSMGNIVNFSTFPQTLSTISTFVNMGLQIATTIQMYNDERKIRSIGNETKEIEKQNAKEQERLDYEKPIDLSIYDVDFEQMFDWYDNFYTWIMPCRFMYENQDIIYSQPDFNKLLDYDRFK